MPTITFKVNLDTVRKFSSKQPYDQYDATIADSFRDTRVTWFPDILRNNRELKHDAQFTLSDQNALYLKNNFTSGEFKFLDILSEVSP